jgi:hypothetical protein
MRRSTSCSEPVLWTCAHLKTIVNHVNHIGIEYYRQMGGIHVVHLKTTYDEGTAEQHTDLKSCRSHELNTAASAINQRWFLFLLVARRFGP